MPITSEENLDLINEFYTKAKVAVLSANFLEKLGGLTIYAGIVDFLCIQAARAMEQAAMKADLQANRPYRISDPGAPHEDQWFYDHRISTRRILKQLSGFVEHFPSHPNLQRLIVDMEEKGDEFLNHRITAIHYIGNPRISKQKMEEAVNSAINAFDAFNQAFAYFREEIHPFTFSEKEKQHFYGDDPTKGIVIMATLTSTP